MKVEKTTLFFIFMLNLILHLTCIGQNIVPNPSFETITSCVLPNGGVNTGYVPPWDSPTDGTPDPYNSCSTSCTSVPNNCSGFQHPYSGNGYTGIGLWGVCFGNDCREYIQVELDSVLLPGQKYCASFYVSLANTSELACNNFGMYFSDIHNYIAGGYLPLNFTPQINDTSIISDTLNWTLVYGQYIAHGGERYIIIGNFFSNALTDTLHLVQNSNPLNYYGYYFVDDVNVHCCTCDSVNIGVTELDNEENIQVYPNPVENELRITNYELGIKEVKLYNVMGEMVLKKEIKNKEIEIDVGDLPKGMYFLQVKNEKGIFNKKIIKE